MPIDAFLFGGRRAERRAARDRGVRLGSRRLHGRDHGLREDGRGRRRGRRAALRPDGDAALLRLPHGRLLRPLAPDRPAARAPSCRRSSWSTGSARTTTASSCGRASARTAACSRGCSERCDDQAEAEETPIGLVPAEGALDTSGLDLSGGRDGGAARVDPEEWSGQLPQLEQHFAQFGDRLPRELRAQLERSRSALTLGDEHHRDEERRVDHRRRGARVATRESSRATPRISRTSSARSQLGDAEVFVDACRAARAAQREWAAVPAPVRGKVIKQIGRLVEDNKEALARLVTREIGKPYPESLGEVQEIIDTCDFFLSEGRRLYGQTVPSRDAGQAAVHLPHAGRRRGDHHGRQLPGGRAVLVPRARRSCAATPSSGSPRSTRPRSATRSRACSSRAACPTAS